MPEKNAARAGWMSKERVLAVLRRHWVFVALVALAALLRILVGVAYGPAFWFPDTEAYFRAAEAFEPAGIRPYGYSLLLNIFSPFDSVWPIILTQHLMGIGCGIALYVFVLHKGGARWLGILAAAPILFDAHELVTEHYLLADPLFTTLLLASVLTLMWEDKLTIRNAAVGGGLLAAALLTRSVGLPLVLLVGVYVLFRRVGWRQIVALALATGVPLLAYMVWFQHYNGAYAFTTWQDRWMYGRVMSIADCDTLSLTPGEKKLCQRPANPANANNVNWYVWDKLSPINDHTVGVKRKDAYTFSAKVIAQQPADFAKLVARETWAYFSPQFYLERREPEGTTCPGIWSFPHKISDPSCSPQPVSTSAFGSHPAQYPDGWFGSLNVAFSAYNRVIVTPGPFLLWCLIAVGVAVCRPGGSWRLRGDALFLSGLGVGLIVTAVATSQFDIRYGLPALVLLPPAAALAWTSLSGRQRVTSPPQGDKQWSTTHSTTKSETEVSAAEMPPPIARSPVPPQPTPRQGDPAASMN